MRTNERLVRANGVDLCLETFGQRGHPALLLIGGAASSMDWWEDGFCDRLAAGPRFVVRYDMRDTGRSTHYEPGAPPYTGADLAADALALLDSLDLSRAHLVGISMGGGIAMRLALDHADRVASLTLMSTSPGGDDLPPMSEELRASFANEAPQPDWSDRAAVIDYVVASLHPFAGSLGVDAPRMRRLAGRIFDRTASMAASMTNHWIVVGGGEPIRPRLGEVKVPTLVVHGTDDPLLPLAHGQALANEVRGARLVPLQGVGHEYPPEAVWDVVVRAILSQTASV
jgi:pimeloyl-ACP methyl ester carboxylesterase